jgi:hypothetical protein
MLTTHSRVQLKMAMVNFQAPRVHVTILTAPICQCHVSDLIYATYVTYLISIKEAVGAFYGKQQLPKSILRNGLFRDVAKIKIDEGVGPFYGKQQLPKSTSERSFS